MASRVIRKVLVLELGNEVKVNSHVHIYRADLAQFEKENAYRFFESGQFSPHSTPTEKENGPN